LLSILLVSAWPLAVRGQAGGRPASKDQAGASAKPKAAPGPGAGAGPGGAQTKAAPGPGVGPGGAQTKAAPGPGAGRGGAQTKAAPGPGAGPAAAEAGTEPEAAADPEQAAEQVADFYLDPKTQAVLAKDFEPLFTNLGFVRIDPAAVTRMAQGQATVDPQEIERFIQAQAKELTDRSNISALLTPEANPNPNNPKNQAIEKATDRLLEPLLIAPASTNARFRSAYTQALLKVMPDLLKNHLFARTEAMIVLSKAGDPQALDLFVAQLNDPEQVMMVKLLAAVGLTNIVQGGGGPSTPTPPSWPPGPSPTS
jgi:hypothetical protein